MQTTPNIQNELKRLLLVLVKRKWTILGCIVAVTLPVFFLTMKSVPVYEATAMIVCEEQTTTIPEIGLTSSPSTSTFMINQIQEIKSSSFIREVVEGLPLDTLKGFLIQKSYDTHAEYKINIAHFINKNLAVESVPRSDVIKIRMRSHNANTSSFIANRIVDKLIERNYNARLEDIRIVENVIQDQLVHFSQRVQETEVALKRFKEMNKVTYLDKESEEIFERITEAEVEYNSVNAQHKAAKTRLEFVKEKLAQEREDLGISITTVTSPWAQSLKERLVELEVQHTSLRVENYDLNHPKMLQLQSQIEETKRNLKKEALKIAQGENIIDPLSRIQNDLEEIATLEVSVITFDAQERALEKVLNNYTSLLTAMPNKELELGRLLRDKNVADQIYTMLLLKQEETKIRAAEKAGNIRMMDPATPPQSPVGSHKAVNIALGIIFGSMLGIGLAFVIETLDTRITKIEDVEEKLNLKVLGSIPKIVTSNGRLNGESGKNGRSKNISEMVLKLLTNHEPKSPAAEAFHRLRTNIQTYNGHSKGKTIIVTSANPGEGKSLIAANLAISTAQQGLKTLIIDADLRRPTIHSLFKIDMEPGLLELLCGLSNSSETPPEVRDALMVNYKTRREDAKQTIIYPTDIRHLFVITSGIVPPNPSDILSLKSMKSLVQMLKKYFDIIIFDLPPTIAVTDAAVMAQVTDGTVFVVRSKKSKVDDLLKAKDIIEKANDEPIMGAILNDVQQKKSQYSRYEYSGRKGHTNRAMDVGQVHQTGRKNKKANENYMNNVRHHIVNNVNGKWAKVSRYL